MNRFLQQWYNEKEASLRELMHEIWEHPETAMLEYRTAKTTAEFMKKEGFDVRTFHAMYPGDNSREANTVLAVYGSGKPVIGILGELDALPGLGNEAVPHRAEIPGPGHGCGHNLINGCGVGAACALRSAMEQEKLTGTLIFIGCPAEESIGGKVWLAQQGYFDNMDVCLMWHPFPRDMYFMPTEYAAVSHILFEFFGKTAHGVFPWNGRSALDACELMNVGANYLREHITPECALHYVYEDGGLLPNIVPDHASVFYYVRSKDAGHEELVERVRKLAEGAAIMTETTMKMTVRSYTHGTIPNLELAAYMEKEAAQIPPLTFDDEEYAYAEKLYGDYFNTAEIPDREHILPCSLTQAPFAQPEYCRGSTDIAEVSHIIPAIQLEGFGTVKDIATHTWGMTACTGMGIGEKSAVYVSKIIAQGALDLMKDPAPIAGFKEEMERRIKEGKIPAYRKYMKF